MKSKSCNVEFQLLILLISFSFCKAKCEWGPWKIGECSTTCGTGLRMNSRNKTVAEQQGEFCLGKSTKTEKCNMRECPGKKI